MRESGIEPSLGTWHFMLIIFCRERGPVTFILNDILSQLEGKWLKLRDTKDILFFPTAMEIASRHLQVLVF